MPDRPDPRLLRILDAIKRPLLFASKDGSSHIDTLKDVELLMKRLSAEAAGLSLPLGGLGVEAGFVEIKEIFSGFDALEAADKVERVERALKVVEAISRRVRAETTDAEIPLGEVGQSLKALRTPLSDVKGIGSRLAERLGKKGLATVEDILYYLPIRYEDRRNIKRIARLTPGENEVVSAEVAVSGEVRYGRRKLFEAVLTDGSGLLKLKWFHYRLPYMKKRYSPGQRLFVYGTVSLYGAQKEIIHPDVELVDEGEDAGALQGVVPIYSQIDKMYQKTIRKLVAGVVEAYGPRAVSGLPRDVLARRGLMDIASAVRELHSPDASAPGRADPSTPSPPSPSPPADLIEGQVLARRSLVFDELFMLELGLLLKRREIKRQRGITLRGEKGVSLEERLIEGLPFSLTRAQQRVTSEILFDMASPWPMNRLLQGDVGSGKTIVSLAAALRAISSGFQAAIMAPTEILAEQHWLTTHRYTDHLGVKSVLLTSSTPKPQRRELLKAVAEGEVDLVIGTHALIQKDVEFKRLGLAVIDEQHRFGVMQRAEIKGKGGNGPLLNILVMTATPIPRTLAMTVFGDLDVSILDEMPPGRIGVLTELIREKDRARAYEVIREEVEAGGQAYIVYPLVEESEELSLKDATNMRVHLARDVFDKFKVGLLHGRMKGAEKEEVMREFKAGGIDILVSTTVIEVGVDVPNATVMFVEHAERFGLAQLHQLRGRVGRGGRPARCLLLAAYTQSADTWKRLKIMEETGDGFRIAEEDLKIRGPGDFIGKRQSGLPDFRMADAFGDLTLLKAAREEAERFADKSVAGEAEGVEAARIMEVLKARWKGRLELASVG